MYKLIKSKPLPHSTVNIVDAYWGRMLDLVREQVIPYQWEALNDRIPGAEPSHAVENFRIAAGESEGKYYGMVFQDSDVAKWLEAAAYTLATCPNQTLEETVDVMIDLIERAQWEDGYLNTHYTVAQPGKRWTDVRRKHELYCAGHLIEAAVAYYEATGKRKFLDVLCRYADHIDRTFGRNPGQIKGYPGHEEIELALIKLYRVTGEDRYLKLSRYFIEERGQKPHFFDIEAKIRGDEKHIGYFEDYVYAYTQSHMPVLEQTKAVGHAVRAMYLYCGIADVAMECGDTELLAAAERLWDNVTQCQMYITGGIGSSEYGEDFTFDYDLPNDLSYTETCASIGLVFFAHRMLQTDINSKYADVMERALYNGVNSGMSYDGKKFFYVNPLEVWPEAIKNRHDHKHVEPQRQEWFGCACCPPNVTRLISSLGQYIYSENEEGLFVHLYVGSKTIFHRTNTQIQLEQETRYPWDGTILFSINPEHDCEFILGLRIPGWCRYAEAQVNGKPVDIMKETRKGYLRIKRIWKKEDVVQLILPMPVEIIESNPQVRENAGKIALQRGPIVYCLEETDNGKNLPDIILSKNDALEAVYDNNLLDGVIVIRGKATRSDISAWGDKLYRPREIYREKVNITAIPYYGWCNRSPGEMLVWLRME